MYVFSLMADRVDDHPCVVVAIDREAVRKNSSLEQIDTAIVEGFLYLGFPPR